MDILQKFKSSNKYQQYILLENEYNWKGIMMIHSFLQLYKQLRSNSIHVINDATNIDYKNLLMY